jgi:hypothetical protein
MYCVVHETGKGEIRNVYKFVTAAPEGKNVGHHTNAKDNAKMHPEELNSSGSVHDQLVSCCDHGNIYSTS